MRLSRRAFLGLLAAVSVVPAVAWANPSVPAEIDRFLKLSAEWTGFAEAELDRQLAELYFAALDGAEPENEQEQVVTMWYSGLYPTLAGTRRAAFRDCLAWKALSFCQPPTYCGPSW